MRFAHVLIVSLSALAMAQTYAAVGPDRALEVGDAVEVTGRPLGGEAEDLVQESDGDCRYFVVVDPTCSSCRVALRRWARDAARDSTAGRFPGWHVSWLVMASPESARTFVGSQERLPVAWASLDDAVLMRQLGADAFPWWFTLDREGRLMDSGVGARLPIGDALTPQCQIS